MSTTLPLTHTVPGRRWLPRFRHRSGRYEPETPRRTTTIPSPPSIPPPPPQGASLAELVAHVDAIAATFQLYDEDPGTFYLTKAQYDAYRTAVARAEGAHRSARSKPLT